MIVLGIDTSGYSNAVGLVNGRSVLADCACDARTDSLEQIVANIDDTLKEAGLTLDDVEGIGVGLGPGSWTGIRVGVTVGKMLAFTLGRPVCGVSTLEALAYPAKDAGRRICAVVSAGTANNVYAAFYIAANEGVDTDGEHFYGDISELLSMIAGPYVLAGRGAEAYLKAYHEQTGRSTSHIKALEAAPSGAVIAGLAAGHIENGQSDDVLSLTPLYLKESSAKAMVNKYRGER